MLYRDAEYARRKDCDYLQAYLQYENIKSEFPKTVYSEAATCYGIKCLLALADEENAQKAKESIQKLEDDFGKERKRLDKLKKSGVPKAAIKEMEKKLGHMEERLKELDSIPTGVEALKASERLTKIFCESNKFGLYRGEAMLAWAYYLLIKDANADEAYAVLVKLANWCGEVRTADAKLEAFDVPDKARTVSRPPEAVKKHDRWGNTVWSEPEIGAILNRRTAPWLLDATSCEAHGLLGLTLLIDGKYDEAAKQAEAILKYDSFERKCQEKGEPNTYKRLSNSYARGRIIAFPQTLKGIPRDDRIRVYVAEYLYEKEDTQEAERSYKSLYDRRDDFKPRAAAYITFMYAQCVKLRFDKENALNILKEFDEKESYKKTPFWWQAKFAQAHLVSTQKDGTQKSIAVLDEIMKDAPEETHRRLALFSKGQLFLTQKEYEKSIECFESYISRYREKEPQYSQAAEKYIKYMDRFRIDEKKEEK